MGDTTKIIIRPDPKECAGLEMIIKGAHHNNYTTIAPTHEYTGISPLQEGLCPKHYSILQTYINDGFRRKES